MNKAFEERLDKKCDAIVVSKEENLPFSNVISKPLITEKDYDTSITIKEAKKIVQEVAEEYNNDWIPCSERLPDEHETMFAKLKGTDKWDSAMPEKISDDVNVTVEFEDGTRKTKTMHTIDGKWKTDINIVKFNVIAWQPLPKPYQQKGE